LLPKIDRMTSLEELEGEAASIWEDLAEARGFNRVVGRVLFTLMTAGEPLSQGEIAERTGYSVPTISRALNTLVALGTGKKVGAPGSRLRRYQVDMRPQELMIRGLAKWLEDARAMRRRIGGILEEMESLGGEEAERAGRLRAFLTELSGSIPGMTEVIERAMREMRAP